MLARKYYKEFCLLFHPNKGKPVKLMKKSEASKIEKPSDPAWKYPTLRGPPTFQESVQRLLVQAATEILEGSWDGT